MMWPHQHRAQAPSPSCHQDDFAERNAWSGSSEGRWEVVQSGGGGVRLMVEVDMSELAGGCCVDGIVPLIGYRDEECTCDDASTWVIDE